MSAPTFQAELGKKGQILLSPKVQQEEKQNHPYRFGEMLRREHLRIQERRRHVNSAAAEAHEPPPYPDDGGNPELDAVALCLSGGGIRSATFNLGLLQALERCNFFSRVDYLSTVSGGGYIGSCLTWFMTHLALPFPFGKSRADNTGTAGAVVRHLRDHGKYLAPGGELDLFALSAAILTGLIVNLAILGPLLLLAVFLLSAKINVAGAGEFTAFSLSWICAAGVLLLFGLIIIVQVLFSSWPHFRHANLETRLAAYKGIALRCVAVLFLVGSVPLAHTWLVNHLPNALRPVMGSMSLLGTITSTVAAFGRQKGSVVGRFRGILITAGVILLLYGLLVLLFDFSQHMRSDQHVVWLWITAASIPIGFLANINYMSMHRYYRNRLMEAFLPYRLARKEYGSQTTLGDSDLCRLKDLKQTTAPYHILNTSIATRGSKETKFRERGVDNFILSPLFCGSVATGYASTAEYCNGYMNLATSMAVSGAAVDPNTPATRSWPLSLLMALLNVRLGYWTESPGFPTTRATFWRPQWYTCILREMVPSWLSEKARFVHLSDGGHFENLGLYEMVRRRCALIIVSDASADPKRICSDLGRAIELVRTDLCARIEIDPVELLSQDADKPHDKPFVTGTIHYDDATTGTLIYIKPTFLKPTPEDVRSYGRQHTLFPNESTSDQFFDEAQFESYRELGFQDGYATATQIPKQASRKPATP